MTTYENPRRSSAAVSSRPTRPWPHTMAWFRSWSSGWERSRTATSASDRRASRSSRGTVSAQRVSGSTSRNMSGLRVMVTRAAATTSWSASAGMSSRVTPRVTRMNVNSPICDSAAPAVRPMREGYPRPSTMPYAATDLTTMTTARHEQDRQGVRDDPGRDRRACPRTRRTAPRTCPAGVSPPRPPGG